jgi:hypothetical protein
MDNDTICVKYSIGDIMDHDDVTTETTENTAPKPLGVEHTGYGEGYDMKAALVNWLNTDPQFENEDGERWGLAALDTKKIEYECLREPYIPKRCKTEIIKQEGSRQWKTTHVVYNIETGKRLSAGSTKQDAIKKARDIALSKDLAVHVKVEKELVEGAAIEAVITPKTKRPGRWKFRASFMC